MMRRLMAMLLVGVIFVCGLVVAQEPATEPPAKEKGEAGPLRLKKKKRSGDPVPVPVEPKEKEPKEKEPKEKEPKPKEDDPLVPEDGDWGDPEEDEADILARVSENMRSVEEKLSNRELGDPTRQQQRDILKDLDALIKKSEQQQGGGGGGGGGAQDQNQDQDQQQKGQKGQKGGASGQKGSMARRQPRGGMGQQKNSRNVARNGQRQPRGGKQPGNKQQQPGGKGEKPGDEKMLAGGNQPKPKTGAGDNPGAGNGGPQNPNEQKTKEYNDVWGHLPETLRAEMNAYSNPRPFHHRYDRVIKEYYKTIASQGRKKGD